MTRILLVAVVLAAACGKKEPKGDCGKAIDHAMALSNDEFKKNGVDEATLPKIREVSVARCTEDKWSNAVLVCMEKAKTADDVAKCETQKSKDQRDNMDKAITAVITAAEAPVTPDPGAGTGSAVAPADGVPAECAEYQATVEKLAACEKLPQASRDMLKKQFDDAAKTWEGFDKLPENARTALIDGCKQGTDAVKKAVAGTCEL